MMNTLKEYMKMKLVNIVNFEHTQKSVTHIRRDLKLLNIKEMWTAESLGIEQCQQKITVD